MRIILSATLAAAAFLGGVSIAAHADTPTHEVPTWMRAVCATEDSTNCYWPGGSIAPAKGESYVRVMPGRAHLTCVFYVNRPKRDYCA